MSVGKTRHGAHATVTFSLECDQRKSENKGHGFGITEKSKIIERVVVKMVDIRGFRRV